MPVGVGFEVCVCVCGYLVSKVVIIDGRRDLSPSLVITAVN